MWPKKNSMFWGSWKPYFKFSKLFNQKASHEPSGQHVLNENIIIELKLYNLQWTMMMEIWLNDVEKSDIILLGVSRTSKTPTSIYLANKGYKTTNIPLVNNSSLPDILKKKPDDFCVIGLTTEAERLADIRKNRINSLKDTKNQEYTNLENIKKEVNDAKATFKKYRWPTIDVTRKSVEETAASVIKIHEIYLNKKNV